MGKSGNNARNRPSRVPFNGSTCFSGSMAPFRPKRRLSQDEAASRHSSLPVMGGYLPKLSALLAKASGTKAGTLPLGSPTERLMRSLPGGILPKSSANRANGPAGKSDISVWVTEARRKQL